LDLESLLELFEEGLQLLGSFLVCGEEAALFHEVSDLLVEHGFFEVHGFDGLKGVPELVSNAGVDELEELVVGLLHVVEDVGRNVDKLDHG